MLVHDSRHQRFTLLVNGPRRFSHWRRAKVVYFSGKIKPLGEKFRFFKNVLQEKRQRRTDMSSARRFLSPPKRTKSSDRFRSTSSAAPVHMLCSSVRGIFPCTWAYGLLHARTLALTRLTFLFFFDRGHLLWQTHLYLYPKSRASAVAKKQTVGRHIGKMPHAALY